MTCISWARKLTWVFLPAITGAALAWAQMPSHVLIPKDNPQTAAKIELGKQLYFDPRVSSTGTVSCNSCHDIMANGTDNRPVSMGVHGKTGARNAPTVFNAAFRSVQFWDGRARSLEEQAKGPAMNPVEMGMPNEKIIAARINSIPGYRREFAAVFGGPNPVTLDHIVQAIASFERTLITTPSPYDHYVAGNKSALSPAAVRGLKLFQSVGCTTCHSGAMFNGPAMPMGKGFYMRFPLNSDNAYVKKYHLAADLGRYEVTHQDADKHLFVVQSLRNVEITAPYFHNGSVKNLAEAVHVMAKTQLNRTLTDAQVGDLVAFLDSLTGGFPKITMPRLPETPNTTPLGQ